MENDPMHSNRIPLIVANWGYSDALSLCRMINLSKNAVSFILNGHNVFNLQARVNRLK